MGSDASRNFWLALTGVGALVVLASGWEYVGAGWHPAREEAALFGAYHLARMAACALAGWVLVWLLRKCLAASGGTAVPVGAAGTAAAWLSLLLAFAFAAVFVASPAAFHELAGEDRPVEWASALLLFAGSALFVSAAATQWRRISRLDLLVSLALAGGYFVLAMEEISWMQRVIGYGTPEGIAARNWQGEFNLHNFNTDITELVFYTGSAAILILLPLLAEAMPAWRPLTWFRTFLPTRITAAIAAPSLIFTYGQWNLLPVQIAGFAGLFVLFAFAGHASAKRERALFLTLAAVVALGQVLFLALGHRMPDIPDASEFKELFIALGFTSLAIECRRRTGVAAPAPVRPVPA